MKGSATAVAIFLATALSAQTTLTCPRETDGVTQPRATYAPDPDYSEEARQEQLSGSLTVCVLVGTDGKVHDVQVTKALGHGLDEKAVAAVRQWTFEPARKNGEPIATHVPIEVSFELYPNSSRKSGNNPKIEKLSKKASQNDVKAEIELGIDYLEGHDVQKDEAHGRDLLESAAFLGSARAQFLLGEYAYHQPQPNYIDAYMWYSLAQSNGWKASDKPIKELTTKMTSAQITEARTRAGKWSKK